MSKSRDIADSAATINFIDNVTSDVQTQLDDLDTAIDNISVTSGTLTKTFAVGESSTINLTSSVLSPVVSATKEVPQTEVTNNSWDAAAHTFTPEDTGYSTTLSFNIGDLSTAVTQASFDLSAQDTSPSGVAFDNDGTRMFVVGSTNDAIYQYNLSAPFSIAGAAYFSTFSVASQDTIPSGITFSRNGLKMYIVGDAGNDICEYILSQPFELGTAIFNQTFAVGPQGTSPAGIAFSKYGDKMFVSDRIGAEINEYNLSQPFDISTSVFSQRLSTSTQDSSPRGIDFNSDGTKLYMAGSSSNRVYVYNLSVAYDISTAVVSANTITTVAARDVVVTSDEGLVFAIEGINDILIEYRLPPSVVLGAGSFSSGDIGKVIKANSGEFLLIATDGKYIEKIPPLNYDPVLNAADWEMVSVVYDPVNDELELSYYDAAYDIGVAGSFVSGLSTTTEITIPNGVAFNKTGTRMYVSGDSSLYQYNLSTPFDLTTGVFNQSTSPSQFTDSAGMALNPEGSLVFVVDENNDAVQQYSISTTTGNLSTLSYQETFVFSAETTDARDIAFSPDGYKMFINDLNNVYEYSLTQSFSVSTASFSKQIDVTLQNTGMTGIAFSYDGTKMVLSGSTAPDALYSYNLSIPFDISSAAFSESHTVATTLPKGLCFNNKGTQLFLVEDQGNRVLEYYTGEFYGQSGYKPAISSNIDTTYWTDINRITVSDNLGSGAIYYAISNDDKTTWSVLNNSNGTRNIVRDNAGTWQYNSNATYTSETWVNATANNEFEALKDAMGVAQNQMDGLNLNSINDSSQITLGTDLAFAVMFYMDSSGDETPISPTYSGTALNYDANILNQGAVLGIDFNYDAPASDKVRITAVNAGNYKIRVV